VTLIEERSGAEFCTAISLGSHGMDPRVCARRFAPCSARGWRPRWAFRPIFKACRLPAQT